MYHKSKAANAPTVRGEDNLSIRIIEMDSLLKQVFYTEYGPNLN
jgi:hypothetical protein